MKIKEVALNEIHWTIDQWNRGDQANDRLSEKLGSLSRYFAKGNVGAETFTWSFDAPLKWTPLNKASEPEAVMARQRWEELKNEVKAKLADTPDLAEHILEIPNEDYILDINPIKDENQRYDPFEVKNLLLSQLR